jgi:hypothetical protein
LPWPGAVLVDESGANVLDWALPVFHDSGSDGDYKLSHYPAVFDPPPGSYVLSITLDAPGGLRYHREVAAEVVIADSDD